MFFQPFDVFRFCCLFNQIFYFSELRLIRTKFLVTCEFEIANVYCSFRTCITPTSQHGIDRLPLTSYLSEAANDFVLAVPTSPSIYNPGHKYLRLVHILNEFFFTTSEEKAFPMTLIRADETLFTYVKRLIILNT